MSLGRKPNFIAWGKGCMLCNSFIVYIQYFLSGKGSCFSNYIQKGEEYLVEAIRECCVELNPNHYAHVGCQKIDFQEWLRVLLTFPGKDWVDDLLTER